MIQDASCLAAVICTFCKVVESEFTPDRNRKICTSPLGTKKLPMDLWQVGTWCLNYQTSGQLNWTFLDVFGKLVHIFVSSNIGALDITWWTCTVSYFGQASFEDSEAWALYKEMTIATQDGGSFRGTLCSDTELWPFWKDMPSKLWESASDAARTLTVLQYISFAGFTCKGFSR